MKKLLALLAIGLVAGAFLILSPKQKSPSPAVVATVGNSAITLESFRQEALRRGAATPAQQKALLDELIRNEVLYASAVAAGYDRNPAMITRIKHTIAGQFEEDQKAAIVAARLTQEEIQAYYQGHRPEFTTPEKAHVALLLVKVPTKATAEKVIACEREATALRDQAKAMPKSEPAFGELALRYSEDQATRYTGGDSGWLARSDKIPRWEKSVVDAAFALKETGALSPVIRGRDGFYLLKLIEAKPAETKPIEQVRDTIVYRLTVARQQQIEREFYQRQLARVPVQVNQPVIDAIQLPNVAAVKTPPAMPR
jgi:hypothetical protein